MWGNKDRRLKERRGAGGINEKQNGEGKMSDGGGKNEGKTQS